MSAVGAVCPSCNGLSCSGWSTAILLWRRPRFDWQRQPTMMISAVGRRASSFNV